MAIIITWFFEFLKLYFLKHSIHLPSSQIVYRQCVPLIHMRHRGKKIEFDCHNRRTRTRMGEPGPPAEPPLAAPPLPPGPAMSVPSGLLPSGSRDWMTVAFTYFPAVIPTLPATERIGSYLVEMNRPIGVSCTCAGVVWWLPPPY